jgi:hypothetical protein
MVFKVKLGYLCYIYNILCVFSREGGGRKLKQNFEGGGARCKSLGTSELDCTFHIFGRSFLYM